MARCFSLSPARAGLGHFSGPVFLVLSALGHRKGLPSSPAAPPSARVRGCAGLRREPGAGPGAGAGAGAEARQEQRGRGPGLGRAQEPQQGSGLWGRVSALMFQQSYPGAGLTPLLRCPGPRSGSRHLLPPEVGAPVRCCALRHSDGQTSPRRVDSKGRVCGWKPTVPGRVTGSIPEEQRLCGLGAAW